METGDTAAQYGEGTCVLVLDMVESRRQLESVHCRAHNACRDSMVFFVPNSMKARKKTSALIPPVFLDLQATFHNLEGPRDCI